MSKKVNKQLFFNVASVVALVLSIFAIVGIVHNQKYSENLTLRETYGDLVLRAKIECLKNPSESCEKEVERTQKQLDDFISEKFSK